MERGRTPGNLLNATARVAIVARYAAHGGESFASHSVHCAISYRNKVELVP